MVTDDDLRWEAERANLQPWSTLVLPVDDHGTTGSETIVGPDQGRTLRHQLEHVGLGAARLRTITRRINGSYECGHWPPTPNAARLALDEQIRRCVFIDGHNDQSRQRVRDAFDTLCLASGVPDPAAAMNEAYEKIVNAEVARLHAETAAGVPSDEEPGPRMRALIEYGAVDILPIAVVNTYRPFGEHVAGVEQWAWQHHIPAHRGALAHRKGTVDGTQP